MNVSILGCGRWGSFLAWYQNQIGNTVTLWGRDESKNFSSLCNSRCNEYVTLDKAIKISSNLSLTLSSCDVVIISISSQALRGFIKSIDKNLLKDKSVVLCMKGLEQESGKRLSQICVEEGLLLDNIAVWVGPGHIQDFTKNIPNCMLIDSANNALTKKLADAFSSDLIRFYYGADLVGSEIGAAAKNVMGIAAGMLDGMGYSTMKGPLMSRGAREIARLIKAMGGNELSAYGLCHLGDYETTLFSPYSNNRNYGIKLTSGESFEKLCEGVYTSQALLELGKKYRVELPITEAVYKVVIEKQDYKMALLSLFNRTQIEEFYG